MSPNLRPRARISSPTEDLRSPIPSPIGERRNTPRNARHIGREMLPSPSSALTKSPKFAGSRDDKSFRVSLSNQKKRKGNMEEDGGGKSATMARSLSKNPSRKARKTTSQAGNAKISGRGVPEIPVSPTKSRRQLDNAQRERLKTLTRQRQLWLRDEENDERAWKLFAGPIEFMGSVSLRMGARRERQRYRHALRLRASAVLNDNDASVALLQDLSHSDYLGISSRSLHALAEVTQNEGLAIELLEDACQQYDDLTESDYGTCLEDLNGARELLKEKLDLQAASQTKASNVGPSKDATAIAISSDEESSSEDLDLASENQETNNLSTPQISRSGSEDLSPTSHTALQTPSPIPISTLLAPRKPPARRLFIKETGPKMSPPRKSARILPSTPGNKIPARTSPPPAPQKRAVNKILSSASDESEATDVVATSRAAKRGGEEINQRTEKKRRTTKKDMS